MKLNKYSISIFFLILIILYPVIYYMSEKKLSESNIRLSKHEYEIRSIINVGGFDQIPKQMSNLTKELNNKYFNEENLLYFYPEDLIWLMINSEEYSVDDNENIVITNPEKNLKISNYYSLDFNKQLIFYISTNTLFSLINEELGKIEYRDGNSKINCENITHKKISKLERINANSFYLNLLVEEQITSKDHMNSENTFNNYKNCLNDRMKIIISRINQFLDTYFEINSTLFEKNIEDSIQNNKSLFYNINVKNFKKEIILLKKQILSNLKKIELEVNYITVPKIDTQKKFQKNFNIYVVSFILSIMIILLIFYVLFFTKNYLKFLKKIF